MHPSKNLIYFGRHVNVKYMKHFVLQSLIRREGHLIVVDNGEAAAAAAEPPGAPRNYRILAVAPNYVID